jgi:outer membrane protein
MSKVTKLALLSGALAASIALSDNATARDLGDSALSKERFQIRVRGIGVIPDDDSTVNIGGNTDISDEYVPEIDFTYFFTENISAELIAATALHEIDYTGGINLGEAWILPPTLTLQYHFFSEGQFDPYIGAGVNYSYFYGEDSGTGFTDLEVDGGFGWALQAGADIWLNDNWGINFDVKKIYLEIDGKLNNGAIRADIDLDPWVIGAGISYRF